MQDADTKNAAHRTADDWRYHYLCAGAPCVQCRNAQQIIADANLAAERVKNCLDELGNRGAAGAYWDNESLLAMRRVLEELTDSQATISALQRERDEARAAEAPVIGEIERIRNVPHEKWEGPCRRCGNAVTLWFNGGELDNADCCGLTYRLTSERIDLVICDYAPLRRTEPA